jgi:hypothetical protein
MNTVLLEDNQTSCSLLNSQMGATLAPEYSHFAY